MRKYFLRGIRVVIFLMILIFSLYRINQVLMPKYILKTATWPMTSSYNQFYEMKNDSIDVIFLGSSVALNAFSPQEVYNNYGIRSYNLGSEQQSIYLSYYWLKEALRFQSPQVVVLDTRFLFTIHSKEKINMLEGMTRKCLDSMKWSEVKREAVSVLCDMDESQSEMSYYLKNIRFHTRWTELKEQDFVVEETRYSELKGFAPIETYGAETYASYTSNGDLESKQEMHKIMKVYLDKMVELCEEEGIELVLVSLPGNPMNDAHNNTLSAYAQEKGLDYYNMCETELYNSIGATLPRESMIGHANLWGAQKISRYVGGLLLNTYGVEPIRDEQYDSTKEYYEHIIKNCELPHITDINEYLKAINDRQYTIFIAVRDDMANGLTDEVKANLGALGLQKDLSKKNYWSYVAVISPENGVEELLTENEAASISGSIRSKKTFYKIESGGTLSSATSSIVIDNAQYCINLRGINIVVYDNCLMKVVDKAAFDTSLGDGRRW